MLTRRGLIAGFAGLLAAPAIVRATSIMPVRTLPASPLGGVELISRYRQEYIAAFEENCAAITRGLNGLIPYGCVEFTIKGEDAYFMQTER